MKFNKYILLGVSILTLSSCTTNNVSSQTSSTTSESSSATTSSQEDKILATIESVRNVIEPLKGTSNYMAYQTTQENNYYGISVFTSQSGEVTIYDDDFYQDLFTQGSEDSISYDGIEERGYDENHDLYSVTLFETDPVEKQVIKYTDGDIESFANYFLSCDFATLYIYDVLEASYNTYMQKQGYACELQTNILDVDFTSDGEKEFEYRLTFAEGNSIAYEFYRSDVLTIENGEITSSISDYYVSVQDATNYTALHTERSYQTIDAGNYQGEKIDLE